MLTVKQFKREFPQYADVPDDVVADALYPAYKSFNGVDRDTFNERFLSDTEAPISLSDVRALMPQYAEVPDDVVADAFRPLYKDMPDETFGKHFFEAYDNFGEAVGRDVVNMPANIARGIGSVATGNMEQELSDWQTLSEAPTGRTQGASDSILARKKDAFDRLIPYATAQGRDADPAAAAQREELWQQVQNGTFPVNEARIAELKNSVSAATDTLADMRANPTVGAPVIGADQDSTQFAHKVTEGVVPSLAIGIGTAALTKNPVAGFGAMQQYLKGSRLEEGRDAGLGINENMDRANVLSTGEAALSTVPVGRLVETAAPRAVGTAGSLAARAEAASVRLFGKAPTQIGLTGFAEGAEEGLTATGEVAYDEGTDNAIGRSNTWQDNLANIGESTALGFAGGAALHGIKDAGSFAVDKGGSVLGLGRGSQSPISELDEQTRRDLNIDEGAIDEIDQEAEARFAREVAALQAAEAEAEQPGQGQASAEQQADVAAAPEASADIGQYIRDTGQQVETDLLGPKVLRASSLMDFDPAPNPFDAPLPVATTPAASVEFDADLRPLPQAPAPVSPALDFGEGAKAFDWEEGTPQAAVRQKSQQMAAAVEAARKQFKEAVRAREVSYIAAQQERIDAEEKGQARTLFDEVRKLGGWLKKDAFQDGIDPADAQKANNEAVGKPVFATQGKTLDQLTELLNESQFFGKPVDAAFVREALGNELAGTPVYNAAAPVLRSGELMPRQVARQAGVKLDVVSRAVRKFTEGKPLGTGEKKVIEIYRQAYRSATTDEQGRRDRLDPKQALEQARQLEAEIAALKQQIANPTPAHRTALADIMALGEELEALNPGAFIAYVGQQAGRKVPNGIAASAEELRGLIVQARESQKRTAAPAERPSPKLPSSGILAELRNEEDSARYEQAQGEDNGTQEQAPAQRPAVAGAASNERETNAEPDTASDRPVRRGDAEGRTGDSPDRREADPTERLESRPVTDRTIRREITVEDTGDSYYLETAAATMLDDVGRRIAAYKQLLGCLSA